MIVRTTIDLNRTGWGTGIFGLPVPDIAKVGADNQFPPTIAVPVHRRRMRSVAKKLLRLPLCIEEQYFGTFENRLGIRT